MELIILIIIFLLIVFFVRKDKDKITESFSFGDFLNKDHGHNNFPSSMLPTGEFVKEDKSMVDHINDFFNTDSGDSDGDDDGGE